LRWINDAARAKRSVRASGACAPAVTEGNIMKHALFITSAAVALALALSATMPASADAVVKASLWDKGGDMDMSKNMGLGMGMHGKMHMAVMGIKIDQDSVPAGKVTFDVTNDSKDVIHEMLVAPVANVDVVLPYNANENRVDEEAANDLGEVSELDPGKSGALQLELKPGTYVLYCNIPGHFMAGMWTVLTVK
jgi:uncharacterized cupredoxin-like copper-binding protein